MTRRGRTLLMAVVWCYGTSVLSGVAGAQVLAPSASEPELAIPTGVPAALAQPITARFQQVDFASAMEFLAEEAGVNIILSPSAHQLGRPVTVHLVEMSLERALEHLLKSQGLLYRSDDEALWVATREEMEAEPLETRVMYLASGPGFFASFEPLSETRQSVALQEAGVRGVTTIKDTLLAVVPSVPGSSILLDERSGALIVTHVPFYLEQIERLVGQLDMTPQQVLIEARFVEVTVTDTHEWGFDQSLTGDASLTKKAAGDGTRGAGLQLSRLGASLARGTKIDFTDASNQSSGLNLTLQGILTGTQYQAVLHALAKNTRSKTLSAPRVTTMNNQTATIKIVTEFVYASRYEATVVREDLSGDGDFNDTVSGTSETRFVNLPQDFVTKDLGIVLNVTPSVGQDLNTITLALRPEVSEKKTDDTFAGEVSLPRFTTRDLETSVVIENGQTVMLGGLMKDTTTMTTTRVPILGSLPLVGKLFRKEDESIERSNLVIFVTAQLMSPTGARLARREPAPE